MKNKSFVTFKSYAYKFSSNQNNEQNFICLIFASSICLIFADKPLLLKKNGETSL